MTLEEGVVKPGCEQGFGEFAEKLFDERGDVQGVSVTDVRAGQDSIL